MHQETISDDRLALNYLGIGALDSLRVLEPAAGIGRFFGVMPAEIVAKAERVAVELDSITARILQYLLAISRFTTLGLNRAISRPPFTTTFSYEA